MIVRTIFFKFVDSFSTEPGGFSGRKLSAFFAILMAAYNLKYADKSIAVEMTTVWLAFALLCLGIVTFQQITEFRNGKVKPETPGQ